MSRGARRGGDAPGQKRRRARRQGRERTALAHIPHPMIGGTSFCGDVTKLVGCPACLSKLLALLLVHVQSVRKPNKSFCGIQLLGSDIFPMGAVGVNPSPVYVSIERAREMIVARRAAGASGNGYVPICPGCESNLERFDEAHRRRPSVDGGDLNGGSPGLPRGSEVADEEFDDEDR